MRSMFWLPRINELSGIDLLSLLPRNRSSNKLWMHRNSQLVSWKWGFTLRYHVSRVCSLSYAESSRHLQINNGQSEIRLG